MEKRVSKAKARGDKPGRDRDCRGGPIRENEEDEAEAEPREKKERAQRKHEAPGLIFSCCRGDEAAGSVSFCCACIPIFFFNQALPVLVISLSSPSISLGERTYLESPP